jgi:hypothetical protein
VIRDHHAAVDRTLRGRAVHAWAEIASSAHDETKERETSGPA